MTLKGELKLKLSILLDTLNPNRTTNAKTQSTNKSRIDELAKNYEEIVANISRYTRNYLSSYFKGTADTSEPSVCWNKKFSCTSASALYVHFTVPRQEEYRMTPAGGDEESAGCEAKWLQREDAEDPGSRLHFGTRIMLTLGLTLFAILHIAIYLNSYGSSSDYKHHNYLGIWDSILSAQFSRVNFEHIKEVYKNSLKVMPTSQNQIVYNTSHNVGITAMPHSIAKLTRVSEGSLTQNLMILILTQNLMLQKMINSEEEIKLIQKMIIQKMMTELIQKKKKHV